MVNYILYIYMYWEVQMKTVRKPGPKNKLQELFFENRFSLLAFFCSAVIMLLVFYCFDMVPFGDVTILRMDLYHQYGPLFAELYERVKSGSSLIYSWNTGFGGTFLGNLFNYLASPLWFVILFFKHENLPDAIALMVLLKSAFAAFFFSYYLRKSEKRNDHTVTAFGVLYSFCGFFIAYYWNIMWIDAMALFPLVILGIERIIDNRKFLLYTVTLAIIMISNYYMAMMVCIFSVLYFLVYFMSHHTFLEKVDKYKPASKISNYRLPSGIAIFAAASVIAALLAMFALLPTAFILRNCSATSGSFPKDMKIYYTIFDFLANHLASLEPTIRSSGTDVLPNVYCGILTVMLIPLYLISKSIHIKEKIAHVLMLAVLFFSFNINYANYVWHGFHFPNDLPYRFSFMYSFFLLIMAYRAIKRIREYTGRELLLCGIGVMGFIVMVQEIGSKNVSDNTIFISLAFAFIYTLVLCAMRNKKFQASSVALLLLCCVISESAIANTDNYSMNQTKENYAGDYNAFAEVKDLLDRYHGDDMYRMELTHLRTRMDPAWYNYHGLSTFSSMAPEKLSNLQSHLGVYGNYINSFTYNTQTPVYNAMMGLQYIVKKESSTGLENEQLYTPCVSNSKFEAYANNYCLPIAFCVHESVENWNHTDPNPFAVQTDFLRRASGSGNIFTPMTVANVYCDNIDYVSEEDVLGGDFYATKSSSGSYGSLTVTIAPVLDQNCYLYVKSPAIETVYVNGDNLSLTQSIDEAYILDLGFLEAGAEVEVEMPLKEDSDSGSVKFYACGIDMDAFEESFQYLQTGQLNIGTFSERDIEGTVLAEENQILYTSIPYDDGWKIYIDGERVPHEDYLRVGDALLAIRIPAGEHHLEMHYEVVGLKFAVTVSVCTFIVLLLGVLIYLGKKKSDAFVPTAEEVVLLEEEDFLLQKTVIDYKNPVVPEPPEEEDGFILDLEAASELDEPEFEATEDEIPMSPVIPELPDFPEESNEE